MKEIELRNVKGCADYSPREQFIRNYISDTLKKVFEEAVSLEQKTCKGRDTLCKYAEFLFEIKEYENAIKYAKRYEAYLTIENKIENREKVKEIIEKSLKKINKR